ncbi:energy transducer TonB [Epilithonimonas caeni]|uniref:energy transducer TonB n=1 Tax=Epilithonimonas caeni TaxID=365343 RepID=UPI0004023B17|nr:energy transducer TonB [Epilithonimonas caeni]
MKNLSTIFGKDNLDEIVFSNRNKAYGAYALRNEYSNQLTKALFIGTAFIASVSVIPFLISALKSDSIVTELPTSGPIILKIVDQPDKPKPTPTSPVQQNIKTVENPEYNPVREVRKEKPLPTKKDFEGAAIGTETKPGEETTITVAPPATIPGPPTVAPYNPPVTKPVEDPDKLINQNEADVAADFKGGINAFRQKVAQGFDTETVSQDGMISAVITFVVEKDGSISNLKVNGSNSDFNSEAERVVKSIKTKWTPAQLKGKSVRSSFRMPISMKIE